MANVVSGNTLAVNARLRLIPVLFGNATVPAIAYSDGSGNFSFSNVASGTYTLVCDNNEVTVTYTPGTYSFRTPVDVFMDVAGNNVTGIQFTPTLRNAANTYNANSF
jgi:hypothetical protein